MAIAAAAVAGNVFLECQSVPTAHPCQRGAATAWGGAKDPHGVRGGNSSSHTIPALSLHVTTALELAGTCRVWGVPATNW